VPNFGHFDVISSGVWTEEKSVSGKPGLSPGLKQRSPTLRSPIRYEVSKRDTRPDYWGITYCKSVFVLLHNDLLPQCSALQRIQDFIRQYINLLS